MICLKIDLFIRLKIWYKDNVLMEYLFMILLVAVLFFLYPDTVSKYFPLHFTDTKSFDFSG